MESGVGANWGRTYMNLQKPLPDSATLHPGLYVVSCILYEVK